MILDRIVEVVDTERFKHITDSALEGLAKRESEPERDCRETRRGERAETCSRSYRRLLCPVWICMRAPPEGDIQRFAYVPRGENSEKFAACWREA